MTEALVVTNAYPSDRAIYRNGFVHARVRDYLAAGVGIEVFYLHGPATTPYEYDYDGVHVRVGDAASYAAHIASSDVDVILVHFAHAAMIEPIREHRPEARIIVWVHGFEAEAWHRRWFNFGGSPDEISAALRKKRGYYSSQNAFLADLIGGDELDVTTVHVSDWFRRTIVEPDLGIATRRFEVIPNVVDTSLFHYRPKDPADRTRILSIRPYESHKYANDLTVATILALADRPWFEDLTFELIGSGKLFKEITAPVAGMANVTLREEYLHRSDIPDVHAQSGIFLCPTRFDSQGVSMCEAMSSGLVPVSTAVAAIPEFVESWTSGLLADPEDVDGLARMIEVLYFNPDLYLRLSESASRSVARQCGPESTTAREIELIRGVVQESAPAPAVPLQLWEHEHAREDVTA